MVVGTSGATVDALTPYVPATASGWLASEPETMRRQVDGSLLFVDISGFTSLSERLAARGRIGAEELTGVLNRVFGEMLVVVSARGGSLMKFGGDALLLLFEGDGHAMQAVAAAVEMRAVLRKASEERTSVGRINLRMSSGIHSGSIDLFLVGSSHKELIVTGPAATTVTDMEGTADASEIVVSGGTRSLLPKDFVGQPKDDGWLLRKRVVHLELPASDTSVSDGAVVSMLVPAGLKTYLSSGSIEPEHRQATVAFVEYRGTDQLIAEGHGDLLARQLDELVSLAQSTADSEGVTFLGSDVDADGGKLILVSGVPSSQHDDEGRLLRTVRAILDARPPIPVKVGVNRGHVFVGDVGTESRRTFTLMGDTVNVAARLMAAAPLGSIYASPGVLDRSSTLFDVHALEPLAVKGKSESLQAYSVGGEIGVRPPVLESGLPFHGRDAELEMLVSIVTTCAQIGTGGSMTITGDTGMGKTRLVREVLDRCPDLDQLLLQSEPSGSDIPYWALRDPLRRLLGIQRGPQAEMVEALDLYVRGTAPELDEVIPLIGDLMHIDVEDNEHTAALDPQFRPERAADALVELFAAVFGSALVVVAEDSHWIDEASLGVLQRLARAASERPWTVILTARREEMGFDSLGDEVALGSLVDEDVRRIAIDATEAAPLRPHELDAVVAKAGGSPLFLTELLRLLRETGSVDELPATLDDVVSNEIDSLAPLTRQVLIYVSVLGRSFRRVVANELLQPEHVSLDEASLSDLEAFLEADGEDRLRFRHAVVHDVAYENLSYKRRRELHQRAGEVIERLAGDDTEAVAEFLSLHFSESGDHEKAYEYSVVAAEKAKAAYANTDAARHYRRAIEAAARVDGVSSEAAARLWSSLGEVQEMSGEMENARVSYGRSRRDQTSEAARAMLSYRIARTWFHSGLLDQTLRAIRRGKRDVSKRDETECVQALAMLEAFEASTYAAKGDPVSAKGCADKAVHLAESSNAREALARAYGVLDWANFAMGVDEPRRGEDAVLILQDLGLTERTVVTLNNLGVFAHLEGNWDLALHWYSKSVEAATATGNVVEAAGTQANMAELLVARRQLADALPLLDEAERVYRSAGVPQGLEFMLATRARLLLGEGQPAEAMDILEELLDSLVEGSDTADYAEDLPEILLYLAQAATLRGHIPRAKEVLDTLASLPEEQVEHVSAGEVYTRALIASVNGDPDRAQLAHSALDISREEGDAFHEFKTLELQEADGSLSGENRQRLDSLVRQLGIRPS